MYTWFFSHDSFTFIWFISHVILWPHSLFFMWFFKRFIHWHIWFFYLIHSFSRDSFIFMWVFFTQLIYFHTNCFFFTWFYFTILLPSHDSFIFIWNFLFSWLVYFDMIHLCSNGLFFHVVHSFLHVNFFYYTMYVGSERERERWGKTLQRSSITNHTFMADNAMTANLPKGYTFNFMSSLYISYSVFYKAICLGARVKQDIWTCLSSH